MSLLNDLDFGDIIKEFRYHIGHLLSFTLTDYDCLRFLRARQFSVERSVQLALKWDEWRHKLLVALPRTKLRYSPNIILSAYYDYFFTYEPMKLLPCLHHGWDKKDRPILWVKLGYIQQKLNEILKHFSLDDLTQLHLVMLEMFEVRYDYMYTYHRRIVTDCVIVFDMTGFDRVTLDMDSVWMLKSWIEMDQNYYPEKLHCLYFINSPWYFSSLMGMFNPFIDKKTRKKIKILQNDFLAPLSENIDISTIPEDLGGTSKVSYDGSYSELSGVSLMQVQAYVQHEFFDPESTRVTTPEEDDSLRAIHSYAVKANRQENTCEDDVRMSSVYFAAKLPPTLTAALNSPLYAPSDNQNCDLATEMTYMSSVFRVGINGVEALPTHDEYVIDIVYDEKIQWLVKRRYSEFVSFRKKVWGILPPSVRSTLPPLPPKTIFNKRSPKVVSERLVQLPKFLSTVLSQIRSEATFDGMKLSSRREEEHQLFLFLDAYKALQSHVEEADYTSDDESGDGDNDSDSSGENNEVETEFSFHDRQRNVISDGGPLNEILHTRHRRISAALLSVCVLVLSLVGNIYQLKR